MRARASVTGWAIGAVVAAAAGGVLFACSSGDDAAAPGSDVDGGADATAGDGAIEAATPSSTIAITLHRTTAGIDVVVKLATEAGPDSTTVPTLTVTNGAASPITKGTNAGEWTCSLVPSAKDVLVEVTAAAYGITAKKTALVLDHVDDSLGQAELVGGLVNTNGVEDGANVSPDGEWLIVASYVPIDFYSCLFAGATMDQSACSTITGPYAAPERPGMLGASRIHGGTYDSHCPSLGITAAQTHAFFPTAAFVFHRQADGTFAEPHVLGADADGCLGPYGYSFAGAPTGTTAGLVFAEDDPLDSPDTKADLYFLSATLGQDNVWGRYAVDGGSAQLFDMKATRIPPVLPTTQGNPALSNGVLAWDDEDQSGGARDLWFAPTAGALPAISALDAGTSVDGGPPTLGPSTTTGAEIQPAFDGDDLYWYGPTGIERATKVGGATDPKAKASWSATTTMLGPSGSGTIVAVGEPTIAHAFDGTKELYFVAIVRVGSSGLDGVVARVPFE